MRSSRARLIEQQAYEAGEGVEHLQAASTVAISKGIIVCGKPGKAVGMMVRVRILTAWSDWNQHPTPA